MKNIVKVSLAAVLASAILPTAAQQPQAATKTFREGAFTAQQANRGEQVYAAKCSACHGDNLAGMESRAGSGGSELSGRHGTARRC